MTDHSSIPLKTCEKFYFYFYTFSLFHICSVLTGITMTSRMIFIKIPFIDQSLYITGSIFCMPVMFFIQDIVTEIYGYTNAKKMLATTLMVFVIYVIMLFIMALIPCECKNDTCRSFSIVAQTLPRHSLSFIASLAISGTINNHMLDKLRLAFNNQFLAIRFISATAIGEACFQILIVIFSWYGCHSIKQLLPLAFASYSYQILFEIVVTPINLFICRHLKMMNIKEFNDVA